ncbi:protein slit-like [Bacillus rossius redtenbacheri]|uniref:protein slit-like n=1 Tax=Bacillus rossius redtenbacheri TaxID=93214 RepID=UPI002FDD421D
MQRSVLVVAAVLLRLAAGADTRTSCALRNTSRSLTADCRSRSLQEVPSDLPSGLTGLSLSNNHLPALDDQLRVAGCAPPGSAACSRFPRLAQLNITHCATASISSRFLHGSHYLVFLSLSNNQLSSLHQDTFIDNKNLIAIDISHNRISSIPQKLFQGLRYLEYLDLSKNQLREIHRETFTGLSNLDKLLLNNNFIKSLDETVFGDLTNMRVLDLEHNNLAHFPRNILRNISSLVLFQASHNYITDLDPSFFSNLHELQFILFRNNSLKRLSKYTFQDLLKKYIVDFSFNMIESLYLNTIPFSLVEQDQYYVLDTLTNFCYNNISTEKACFISELGNNRSSGIFHNIDFSFNNVSVVSIHDANLYHSLEFLNLSLTGNTRVNIPVKFIKREGFITELYIDGADFDWKNFTLVNEIFQLKNLKVLSIIGCGACEYYIRNLLFSIFNPRKTIKIICKYETTEYDQGFKRLESLTDYNSPTRTPSIVYQSFSNKTMSLENFTKNLNHFDRLQCEIIANITVIVRFDNPNVVVNVTCARAMDCSYSVVKVVDIFTNLKNLSCVLFQHSGIKFVPKNYFHDSAFLKHLDLSFNSLKSLPDDIFYFLESLVVLKLEHNMLTYLQPSLFMNLTKLSFLSLKGNRINSYDPNTFAPLSQLKVLLLDFYGISYLHNESFLAQRNLIFLEINQFYNSSLFTIHHNSSLNHLNKLQSITLNGFNINSSLSNLLFSVTKLKELTIKNSLLVEIFYDTFGRFSDLVNLKITKNQVEKISENAFQNLTKIISIDISLNKISILPRDLFINTLQLETLNLSYNKIENFHVTLFHRLALLKILDISDNFIAKIDWYSFAYLFSIRGLKLQGNMIIESNYTCLGENYSLKNTYSVDSPNVGDKEAFGKHFAGPTQRFSINRTCPNNTAFKKLNLRIIDLQGNGITFLSKETFFDCPILLALTLSENKISVIDNEIFKNTPLLKLLYLHHNYLVSINKTLFGNLFRLETLDLRFNQIEFIEDGAFTNLSSLKTLRLNSNRLKSFNAKSYFYRNILVSLFIHDNFITINNTDLFPLKDLNIISLHNNNLGKVTKEMFELSRSLGSLVIKNSSILTLHPDAFQNNPELTVLLMNENPVHSLTPHHFSYLQDIVYLDMSNPRVIPGNDAQYAGLSWKNMTLLNYFFELDELQYLIFAGNPICEPTQWTQIMDNLFLSEKWRTVVCSEEFTVPSWYANAEKKVVSFNIDMVTRL